MKSKKNQHQQQKDDANCEVAVYWENFIHNAKKGNDLERTRKQVEDMEETMRKADKVIENQIGGLRPIHTPTEGGDSNNDSTVVQLSEEKILGFNFYDE